MYIFIALFCQKSRKYPIRSEMIRSTRGSEHIVLSVTTVMGRDTQGKESCAFSCLPESGTSIPHSSLFNSDVRKPSWGPKDILKISLFSHPFNGSIPLIVLPTFLSLDVPGMVFVLEIYQLRTWQRSLPLGDLYSGRGWREWPLSLWDLYSGKGWR